MVTTAYIQGTVPNFADSVGVLAFLGPTVSVAVVNGQEVLGWVTATLGTTNAGGAAMSRISMCHQAAGGGALVDHLNDYSSIRVPLNTRLPVHVAQRIANLATGTYNVGLCYQTTAGQAATWNDNDWINVMVAVVQ